MPSTGVFIPTRPPRAHQVRALNKARGRKAFFYRMEMGTGKSKVAWDEAQTLYLSGEIDRVLIVAGKGSYGDWMDKHLPENTPDYIHVVAHLWDGGGSVREQNALRHMMSLETPVLRCLIMNVEAFGSSKVAATVAGNFVSGGRTLIVCDESTKIRNREATRSKVMVDLGVLAEYRRAMTGLATPKSPLDLWGQMLFLGLEGALGTSFHSFKLRFCRTIKLGFEIKTKKGKSRKPEKIVGFKNLSLLRERLDLHSFRILKEECLDLPPKIYQRVLVDLTDQQRKAYNDMVKIAMTELKEGVFVSATHAMTRLMKLHQIVSGFVKDEMGVVHHLDTNRLDAMWEVANEMEGKVAIWCLHRDDVSRVVEHIRGEQPDATIVEYHGGVSQAAARQARIDFQEGDADFFVATYAKGGFGITLTACHNVIDYSHTWDLEHRLQAEDRFHRDGQNTAVTYVDLVTPNTVDVRVLKALIEKKRLSDEVEGGDIRQWLEFA